jgi:uncharacterized protein (DUF433 family)
LLTVPWRFWRWTGVSATIGSDNEALMATHPSITRNPNVLVGKPVIKGTRISVEFILELLSANWNEAEILANYPHITRDDILACLSYAHDVVHETSALSSAAE